MVQPIAATAKSNAGWHRGNYYTKYLDFPLPFSIKAQNLSSLFAGKCHALLCRNYTKGRDWYDFSWYVSKQTPVNFDLLTHAIDQAGPWKDQHISVTSTWLVQQLEIKIQHLDLEKAKEDAMRFLRPQEQNVLNLWSKDFFLTRLEKLKAYLKI